ncbi:type VII toxin-antitoxin system MntA family adenylyltransferase antitoxin [Candidatus Pyrohabitans sp.]
MKIHTAEQLKRKNIAEKLRRALYAHGRILFAYLHGSFLSGRFRDVDVAIYLREPVDKRYALKYEMKLERELEDKISLPVDIRILNLAPLSFRFGAIKNGVLLFSRDESRRVEFECRTIDEYHDFKFHRDTYRREAIGIEV